MRVLFTGNIDNIAYSCAKFTRKLGIDADVLISSVETDISHPFWEDDQKEALSLMRVFTRRYGSGVILSLWELHRIFSTYDVVVAMGMMAIPALVLARDYCAVALGADMKELVFEKNFRGWLMDQAFRRARVLFFNDVDHLPAVAARGYEKALYFPVPVDTDKYRPGTNNGAKGQLRLVHGASLSWSLDWTENKELQKRTLKRNDLFFQGLKIYTERRPEMDVEAIVPLWGPDKDKVAPLCAELGIGRLVRLVPKVNKEELKNMYYWADVVIDQFNMPRLGYNAFEAMACGKPVVGHFSEELQNALYPELPPMLNADDPEGIADCLEILSEGEQRAAIGHAAREWILKHHSWKPVIKKLLDQCGILSSQR